MKEVSGQWLTLTQTTTTTVLWPFFRDHPGEPVPDENFWTLWCNGKHTDHPVGRHSIWTNQCPSPPSPIFFTGRMPFLPPNQPCQSTEGIKILNNRRLKLLCTFVYKGNNHIKWQRIPKCLDLMYTKRLILHTSWLPMKLSPHVISTVVKALQ